LAVIDRGSTLVGFGGKSPVDGEVVALDVAVGLLGDGNVIGDGVEFVTEILGVVLTVGNGDWDITGLELGTEGLTGIGLLTTSFDDFEFCHE
jgi:hypothetical protein